MTTCPAATVRGRCKRRVTIYARRSGICSSYCAPTASSRNIFPAEELRRFDDHMKHVRGLALKTRSMALHTVRLLLLDRFGARPVVFSAIKPEDVRAFVAACQERYTVPSSSGLTSALSGYFRFRATRGDQVHGLIGVLSRPANWQLASLPKALNSAEVERLLGALGQDGPSARRANAMVRCALALG